MQKWLGRPLEEALQSLVNGDEKPCVHITAAPARPGQARVDGTLRIIACRGNEWIVARFMDQAPKEKEEA